MKPIDRYILNYDIYNYYFVHNHWESINRLLSYTLSSYYYSIYLGLQQQQNDRGHLHQPPAAAG